MCAEIHRRFSRAFKIFLDEWALTGSNSRPVYEEFDQSCISSSMPDTRQAENGFSHGTKN